jgi:hypothetical protein
LTSVPKILVKIENWFVNLLFYFYEAGRIDLNMMMINIRTKVHRQLISITTALRPWLLDLLRIGL